jgi:hypothetical protein
VPQRRVTGLRRGDRPAKEANAIDRWHPDQQAGREYQYRWHPHASTVIGSANRRHPHRSGGAQARAERGTVHLVQDQRVTQASQLAATVKTSALVASGRALRNSLAALRHANRVMTVSRAGGAL